MQGSGLYCMRAVGPAATVEATLATLAACRHGTCLTHKSVNAKENNLQTAIGDTTCAVSLHVDYGKDRRLQSRSASNRIRRICGPKAHDSWPDAHVPSCILCPLYKETLKQLLSLSPSEHQQLVGKGWSRLVKGCHVSRTESMCPVPIHMQAPHPLAVPHSPTQLPRKLTKRKQRNECQRKKDSPK